MVFAGHDMICENGEILAESEPFGEGLAVSEIDVEKLAFERRRINTYYENSDASGYEIIPFSACKGTEALTRAIARLPFVPQGRTRSAGARNSFSPCSRKG